MFETTINAILSVSGEDLGDPQIEAGEFLFSTHEQRDQWADQWSPGDEHFRERVESLFRFGRSIQQHGDDRKPVSNPADVIAKLARERYKYPSFHWVVWPLLANRQHAFEVTPNGGRRYQRIISKYVPKARDLPRIERGGGYLLLYMGPPESVLESEKAREALARLCQEAPVLDVLFRKYAGQDKILYSVRAGEGYFKAKDGSDAVAAFPKVDLSWFQLQENGNGRRR